MDVEPCRLGDDVSKGSEPRMWRREEASLGSTFAILMLEGKALERGPRLRGHEEQREQAVCATLLPSSCDHGGAPQVILRFGRARDTGAVARSSTVVE